MKNNAKRIVLFAVIGVVVLAVAAVAFVKVAYLNKLKPTIEQAASEATGLDVKVGGIGLELFPRVAVSVDKINVKGDASEVMSVGEVNIAVELGPLLSRRLAIKNIEVLKPVINIVLDKGGKYNFEGREPEGKAPAGKKKEKASPLRGIAAENIVLRDGRFVYTDMAAGSKTTLDGLDVDFKDLSVEGISGAGDVQELMKAISFSGKLKASSFEAGNYRVTDITSDYRWKNGVFDISPMQMKLFGGTASGKCVVDLGKKKPGVTVTQDIKGLDLGLLVKEVSGKDTVKGRTDVMARLAMSGASAEEIKRSLNGSLSMRGGELVLYGADLDASIAKLKETQRFNIFDAGSFLVLGPIGPLLSKGASLAGAAGELGKGEKSLIKKYTFDWDIRQGIASASDVAFATTANRLAFKGQLDIVNERFADLTAAVLLPGGCARFEQTITGPFAKPKIKKEGLVKSALKPVTSILGKFIPAPQQQGRCQVFYSGSVEHPGTQ